MAQFVFDLFPKKIFKITLKVLQQSHYVHLKFANYFAGLV